MAAANPIATTTDAPSTEEASKTAAPPVLVAEAGLAPLALVLVPVGWLEAAPVLTAAPVFVAAVLLTFPAAGFAVAPASVADADVSPFAAPAVIVTGTKEMESLPRVVLMTLGTLSTYSVIEDSLSFAPVCEAVQIALVVPWRMQSMVAVMASKV